MGTLHQGNQQSLTGMPNLNAVIQTPMTLNALVAQNQQLFRPKQPKTQQWADKVMASVFWDAHDILFIDYLEKGKTINSDYYMALLNRLSTEIKKKRPHIQKKKVLFQQDNDRATSP